MCSVGGMALHGEGDGGRRTELAMFAPALLAPVGLADGDGDAAPPRAVVIPAPGEDGLLETFDGRKHRIADPPALAAAIGAQPVQVRVDTDHQSEPVSPTWRGSTHACGWLCDFRAEPNGAITAAFRGCRSTSGGAWGWSSTRARRGAGSSGATTG